MATERFRGHFRYERGESVGVKGQTHRYTVQRRWYTDKLDERSPNIFYDLKDAETGAYILHLAEKHLIAPPREKME